MLVQPGYLYDLPAARIGRVLLVEPDRFAHAVASLAARVATRVSSIA